MVQPVVTFHRSIQLRSYRRMKSEVIRNEVGFGKKRPIAGRFWKFRSERIHADAEHVLCANFVKFGWPEVGEVARCLHDKKNKKSQALPLSLLRRSRPKSDNIYSECPKFHPNPFISGGVIDERVNVVQTRHKVFSILGEASASSPSDNKREWGRKVPSDIS